MNKSVLRYLSLVGRKLLCQACFFGCNISGLCIIWVCNMKVHDQIPPHPPCHVYCKYTPWEFTHSCMAMAHVQYINILIWLQGFQDKPLFLTRKPWIHVRIMIYISNVAHSRLWLFTVLSLVVIMI